jgi:hypothetical protein
MPPKTLKKSQTPTRTFSPESIKEIKTPLAEISRNAKPIKVMLFSKSGFHESPKRVRALEKKRKRNQDDDNDEVCDETRAELLEEERPESLFRRTRSHNPDLYAPLPAPTHSRRSKVHPALTPWLDDWNVPGLNDFYPTAGFKWDNSDVPDFDLGEPLVKTNFWEGSWTAANEESKQNRYARAKKRKKQLRYGGLKSAGRKRAFKKRVGVTTKRENGKFVKLESDQTYAVIIP